MRSQFWLLKVNICQNFSFCGQNLRVKFKILVFQVEMFVLIGQKIIALFITRTNNKDNSQLALQHVILWLSFP